MQHWSVKNAAVGIFPLFLAVNAASSANLPPLKNEALFKSRVFAVQVNDEDPFTAGGNSVSRDKVKFQRLLSECSPEVSSTAEGVSYSLTKTPAAASSHKGTLLTSLSSQMADALSFMQLLHDVEWRPNIWWDEGELAFEWIKNGKHAVVSFEGDGRVGYTLLQDGKFVSGELVDPPATIMPDDLRDYLTVA